MATGFKTGGRQPGTPNKLNAAVKEAIAEAFQRVGSADYLEKLAATHPQVFCALVGKLVPPAAAEDSNGNVVPNVFQLIWGPKPEPDEPDEN